MSIIICADTQVARIWDKIKTIIPKGHKFVNANKLLKKVTKKVNKEDILISNGDNVDYYYSDYYYYCYQYY